MERIVCKVLREPMQCRSPQGSRATREFIPLNEPFQHCVDKRSLDRDVTGRYRSQEDSVENGASSSQKTTDVGLLFALKEQAKLKKKKKTPRNNNSSNNNNKNSNKQTKNKNDNTIPKQQVNNKEGRTKQKTKQKPLSPHTRDEKKEEEIRVS